jgi:hypothetical protein
VPGTKVARSVNANDQGYFVIPALHPSTYDVTAAAPGFANFSENNVTLLADQSLTVDFQMKVGQATETVTVETNSLQVNTSTSTLSQVVEEKRIVDLPLNGRNPSRSPSSFPAPFRPPPTELIRVSTRPSPSPSPSLPTAPVPTRPASTSTAPPTTTSTPTSISLSPSPTPYRSSASRPPTIPLATVEIPAPS